MSNFNKAIAVVLEHEGGYVNNPKDPGGETKYGITKRSYPNVDIKNLTVDEAKAIYFADFWTPAGYENINYDDVATKIFDTAVNVGNKRAFRFAQQAANACGAKLVVDGVLGSKSYAAINSIDPKQYLAQFRKIQADYYKSLVDGRPSLSVFLRGWLRRAES